MFRSPVLRVCSATIQPGLTTSWAGGRYRDAMRSWRLTVVALVCLTSAACAGSLVRPALTPANPATEALLVLPGFGYGRGGEDAFRSLAPSMAKDGFDLYLPKFVDRAGLDESRDRLRQFVRSNHLERYTRVHVFAFIAGGWTFNPIADGELLPNLATVIYDRSPYQERAPRVAMERLRFFTWLKYGSVVFDVAKTPYAPLQTPDIKVGLVVETAPTAFIKRFAADARRQGPVRVRLRCVQTALRRLRLRRDESQRALYELRRGVARRAHVHQDRTIHRGGQPHASTRGPRGGQP